MASTESRTPSPQPRLRSGELSPATVWRSLLQRRLDQVRVRLPADLMGTFQLAVRSSGRTEHFFVALRGRETQVQPGLHPSATAWIDAEAEGLTAWLEGGAHPPLEVVGDMKLVRRFFEALAAAPKATGFVGIRLGGAL